MVVLGPAQRTPKRSQGWHHTPVIPALARLRREEQCDSEANLGSAVSSRPAWNSCETCLTLKIKSTMSHHQCSQQPHSLGMDPTQGARLSWKGWPSPTWMAGSGRWPLVRTGPVAPGT